MCQRPREQLLSSRLLPLLHSPSTPRPSLAPPPFISLQGLDRGFTWCPGDLVIPAPPQCTLGQQFQTQELSEDQQAPVAAQPLKYYTWENPQETNQFRGLRVLTLNCYQVQELCLEISLG